VAVAALAVLALPHAALAQHHRTEATGPGDGFSASLGIQAAGFDTALYAGSYRAVIPTLGWSGRGLAASAALGLYHIDENGRRLYGPGDLAIRGHATVVTRDAVTAGVAIHASLPTGAHRDGLGMGHVMVMPSVWVGARLAAVSLDASAGYARALVALGGSHHDHGAWPLVDPMTLQELTWSAGATVALGVCTGSCVRVGAGLAGAQPFGVAMTTPRVAATARLAWSTARVGTALEASAGLAGDPFTVRGMVVGNVQF
jgi:hypothetical protein